MNTEITGLYCPINSYLRGKLKSKWIPSDETNIAATFAREIAKMRYPLFDVYDSVDKDHYMMFANGFKP